MNYTDRLRYLAVNDDRLDGDFDLESSELDPKTVALVRVAALIAVGAAVPSYGAQADAAVNAGASAAELVEVLMSVRPIVGNPRVVAAAPRLAMALGYDIDAADE